MPAKYLVLLAAQHDSGQTTIACNLGAALRTQGKRVLLVSLFENLRLVSWNGDSIAPVHQKGTALSEQIVPGKTHLPDYLIFPVKDTVSFAGLLEAVSALPYDVVWILTGQPSVDCLKALAEQSVLPLDAMQFLLCTTLENRQDSLTIRSFLESFTEILRREIDWIIPNKLKVREWESNSQQLMDLGEWFGYEKVVDMLPECSRIHELALDHKTVWQVPVDQIRFAFTKLLELIET